MKNTEIHWSISLKEKPSHVDTPFSLINILSLSQEHLQDFIFTQGKANTHPSEEEHLQG